MSAGPPLPDSVGTPRFNHIGLPTTGSFEGEIRIEHLGMTVSDHLASPFRIQWQRYDADAPFPDLVRTVAHVAFEVDDLDAALQGHEVIVPPNSPAPGLVVAMIAVRGAPVELMEIDREVYEGEI